MGSGSPEIFSEITSLPDQNGKAAPSRLVSVFGWARKGFWAVLDQGLFAGSNFLVSVLLARWLEPASYGAFSVAYSVFLLLDSLCVDVCRPRFVLSRRRLCMVVGQGVFLLRHLLIDDGMARKGVGSARSCIPSPR